MTAAQGYREKPKRTDWGVSLSRHGIFIGTPRLLDVTWGIGLLTVRTYSHYLRLRPFGFGRTPW